MSSDLEIIITVLKLEVGELMEPGVPNNWLKNQVVKNSSFFQISRNFLKLSIYISQRHSKPHKAFEIIPCNVSDIPSKIL